MIVSDSSPTQLSIAGERHEEVRLDTPIQSDALLQASRRVDWRFLLPDPNLGQVAYLGPARGTLLESVKLFSAALTLVKTPPPLDPSLAQYDVVVAHQPSYLTLLQAATLARRGGFLYVEAYGLFWPGRRQRRNGLRVNMNDPRLRYPSDYLDTLRRLGFAAVEAYWHWPSFEACAEIVSLSDQAALLHALGRRRSDWAARLQSTIGRWLVRTGWLARLVPCFSVVAHHEELD